MLDRFEVFRDAEKICREWGEVEYLFPHLIDTRFIPGAKIGVVIDASNKAKSDLTKLRYGHMQFGYKENPTQKKGSPIIYEEHLLSGETYQPVFKKRRCLVIVDRWVYHRRGHMGAVNWFCFHPVEKTTMAFAGLYNTFSHPNGTKLNSVGIIGLSSNEFYRDFEDRMPAVFLPGPEAIQFLNPKLSESKALEILRAWPDNKIMVEPWTQYGGIGE